MRSSGVPYRQHTVKVGSIRPLARLGHFLISDIVVIPNPLPISGS